MTDEEAIRRARASGFGPVVKVLNGSLTKPYEVITVDLHSNPPRVTRVDDPYPHIRK